MFVIFVLYIDSIYLLHTYNICIYTVYILIMFTLPVKLLGCKLLCLGLGGLFTRMIAFPPFVELRWEGAEFSEVKGFQPGNWYDNRKNQPFESMYTLED